jgi:hypothetical protein
MREGRGLAAISRLGSCAGHENINIERASSARARFISDIAIFTAQMTIFSSNINYIAGCDAAAGVMIVSRRLFPTVPVSQKLQQNHFRACSMIAAR